MRITRKQLESLRPFGDWGYHVSGTAITKLCRSYRFEMIANNSKRGTPLHLLLIVPASKLSPEAIVRIDAGACFRAVGRIELWPSNSHGVPDHPPHLFVTEPIEIDETT